MAQAPDLSARRAELTPQAAAFHDDGTGRRWTFADVEAEAIRLAAAFGSRGIVPGDRVGVLSLNRAEVFVALFAARKAGVVLVPLNWRAPVAELAPLAAKTGLRHLIHDSAHAATAASLGLPRLPMRDSGGFGLSETAFASVPVAEDDPWYLLFTSGTTGQPKAVIQTARMAAAVATNLAQAMGLTGSDRSVCYLPLFHTAGINLFALPLFQWGGFSHVLPRFDASRLISLMQAGEVTQFFGVPTIWQSLAAHPDLAAARLDRIRGLASGGAALTDTLIQEFAARVAIIRNGFGMTETGPTGFLIDAEAAVARIGSVGKPQMLTEARRDGDAGVFWRPASNGRGIPGWVAGNRRCRAAR